MEIVMSILLLLGGVGVFIAGMQQMSKGIEQSAGKGVRRMFDKISGKRVAGYGVGIGTTAVVQSSSATSIMTIGLANAGVVNVPQGASIILGAKVGTTLTAFIFAMTGISKGAFSMGIIFASLSFIGVLMSMICKKENLKKLALFLTGFGMLFLGLEAMGMAIGDSGSVFGETLSKLFQYEAMKNPIVLLIIGTVFTCIIQSSTAATGIFITLLKTGVLPSVDQSFFLIMGANIGTCMDGIMAGFGSNTAGKRIALFHVLTSTIGAVLFTAILMLFRAPIVNLFNTYILKPEWSLAVYNLLYNLIYTLLLLPLIPALVKLTEKLIKEKSIPEKKVLGYLDDRLLTTPAIAVTQIKKEVKHMALLAAENLNRAFNALVNNDVSQEAEVRNTENIINQLNQDIADFLIKFSSVTENRSEELLIGTTHHIINDIERIGDHAQNFMDYEVIISKSGENFSDTSIEEIKEMYAKVREAMLLGVKIYAENDHRKLEQISALEEQIDTMNRTLADRHISRLANGVNKIEVQYFYDIISELERIGDHVINIAYSIDNPLGHQVKENKQDGLLRKKKGY